MIRRIRKIRYINHPRLGNLELNFCDKNNKAIDTIIIAGENGTCKSTILDSLYKLCCCEIDYEADVEVENEVGTIQELEYRDTKLNAGGSIIYCKNKTNSNESFYVVEGEYQRLYYMPAIYSDVDINFNASNVTSVTSVTLDSDNKSRRSNNGLPDSVKHLLIDVQSQDDSELSYKYRSTKESGEDTNSIVYKERMKRFKTAFNNMFDNLQYDRIVDENNQKEIYFRKGSIDIKIDDLSSGEKQIVYRGCFLLRDREALNGPFVFIDEPEISLHPRWQKKILDYYKDIYTDEKGSQTSQIFVVTHSPFIIHNEKRKNDKVIITKRNEDGTIVIDDKSEYYKCNSIEVVKDAFNLKLFEKNVENVPTVFLEGQTDEKYFNKAIEVYEYHDILLKFKWVGYVDENGNEYNTGKGALDKIFYFLAAQNYDYKNICLYDCDANKTYCEKDNTIMKSIKKYNNTKGMDIGVENALVLDKIDVEQFKVEHKKEVGYGCINTIQSLDKMALCNYICSLDNNTLREVFQNIKTEIDELLKLVK